MATLKIIYDVYGTVDVWCAYMTWGSTGSWGDENIPMIGLFCPLFTGCGKFDTGTCDLGQSHIDCYLHVRLMYNDSPVYTSLNNWISTPLGMDNDKDYMWHVTGEDEGYLASDVNPPIAPTLIVPSNNSTASGTTVNFQWARDPTSIAQWIQISYDSAFSDMFYENWNLEGDEGNLNIPNFPDDGTWFYWRVRSANTAGWGPWSSVWNFINGVEEAEFSSLSVAYNKL